MKPAWPALVWLLQHTALNAAEPRQQHRTKQQLVFRCTDSAFGVPGAMVILPPAATETIRAPSMVCLLERPASMVLAKGRKVEPRANRATPPLFSLFPRFEIQQSTTDVACDGACPHARLLLLGLVVGHKTTLYNLQSPRPRLTARPLFIFTQLFTVMNMSTLLPAAAAADICWEIRDFDRLKSWSSAKLEAELERSGHSARIDPY